MRVADTVGESVDNRTRLELLRTQEQLIREEAQEKEREVGGGGGYCLYVYMSH